ncbi:unnamed protein product [Musa textilis]
MNISIIYNLERNGHQARPTIQHSERLLVYGGAVNVGDPSNSGEETRVPRSNKLKHQQQK